MVLLIFFSLLVLGALLAACACWVACLWLLSEQRAEAEAARPRSLSQSFAREIDARRLWRSLSAWMAAKPLRLEDGRADRTAG